MRVSTTDHCFIGRCRRRLLISRGRDQCSDGRRCQQPPQQRWQLCSRCVKLCRGLYQLSHMRCGYRLSTQTKSLADVITLRSCTAGPSTFSLTTSCNLADDNFFSCWRPLRVSSRVYIAVHYIMTIHSYHFQKMIQPSFPLVVVLLVVGQTIGRWDRLAPRSLCRETSQSQW